MSFIETQILGYSQGITETEPEVLAELRRETHLKVLYPQMLTDPLVGRLLAMISRMIQPARVLEVGTFTGYGSICLAEGLREGGQIISLEINEEREFIIQPAWEAAGISDRAKVIYGPALESLSQVSGPLDLVYLDADKQNYLNYYQEILPKMRKGGILLADNALWSGKVIDPDAMDKETLGIREFNEYLRQDSAVHCLLLPIDDGLLMAQKK